MSEISKRLYRILFILLNAFSTLLRFVLEFISVKEIKRYQSDCVLPFKLKKTKEYCSRPCFFINEVFINETHF